MLVVVKFGIACNKLDQGLSAVVFSGAFRDFSLNFGWFHLTQIVSYRDLKGESMLDRLARKIVGRMVNFPRKTKI